MGDIADYYRDQELDSQFDKKLYGEPIDKTIWYQSNGEPILIKDMTDSHLMNSINKIKRENWRLAYYPILMKELESREF